MIATIISIAVMFVAGFGFGWCLRGDRALKREREREAAYFLMYDAEIRRLHLARIAHEARQKNKEKHRWS